MSAENRLTSIVSYPERGTGGNNRYRGNCSPKLIEDLIGFFKPAEICDYMCGSGTTQDAAHSMGIISHCYDLHSGFDLINCDTGAPGICVLASAILGYDYIFRRDVQGFGGAVKIRL